MCLPRTALMRRSRSSSDFRLWTGIVVDSDTHEMPCAEFIRAVKKVAPTVPVIDVCTPLIGICPGADHHLETYDPAKLLELLESLRPEGAAAIETRRATEGKRDAYPGLTWSRPAAASITRLGHLFR